ncbi:MAG: DUF2516 family protein [Acidimicrobiales bacterium]
MLADSFGAGFAEGLVIFASFAVTVWAVADAISRPSMAFRAARSSKAMWIALIAVFYFFTLIVGTVLAVVYLAAIRPRVRAVSGGP